MSVFLGHILCCFICGFLLIPCSETTTRFTRFPPSVLYVSSGGTARFVWDYYVDDRNDKFSIESPIWSYYNQEYRNFSVIGADDRFTNNWSFVINRKTCPPRLLNPDRVSRESNATLVITGVTTADNGIYWCTLVLKAGNPINHQVQLVVTVHPTFLSNHPNKAYRIVEEHDLRINCTAIGPPTPNITWVNITDGSSVTKSQGTGSAVLNIDNIQRYHAGEYECQAKNNPNKDATTTRTTVTVYLSGSISTPDNAIKTVGQDVVLMWNTTNNNSILSATWGLLGSDGKTITPQFIYISTRTNGPVLSVDLDTIAVRYKGRVSWVGDVRAGHAWFKITNLTLQDTNQYVVAIREQGQNEASQYSVHLTIAVSPKFLSSHPNRTYEVIEGQDLKINCTAIGPPTPNIVTDGSIVTKSQGSGIAGLNIDNIQRYDAGEYECQAKNYPNENPTIIKTRITVYYKPTISKEMSSKISSWNGKQVTLSCTVSDGLPTPSITWYNPNRQQISTGVSAVAKRSQVVITTNSKDYGSYKCKATNIAGSDEHLINVTQLFQPGPVTVLTTKVQASALTVKWTKPDDGGGTVTGYLIEVSTKPPEITGNTYAVITGLKAGTQYTLEVTAKNIVGYGATAETLVTTKLTGKPSIPYLLAALLDRQESKLSVLLRWSRPDQNGGSITRYAIYTKEMKPGADWIKYSDVNNPQQVSYRIIDTIIHGKTYKFLVTAWNEYGESVRDERSARTVNTTADIGTAINAMEYCGVKGSIKSSSSSAVLGVIIALFVLSLVFNLLLLLYLKRRVNPSRSKESQAQTRKTPIKTGPDESYENDFELEDKVSPAATASPVQQAVPAGPEYETINQAIKNANQTNEASNYQELNMLPNTSIQGPDYEPLRTRSDKSREQRSYIGQHPYEPLNVRNQNTTYQSLHSNESAI